MAIAPTLTGELTLSETVRLLPQAVSVFEAMEIDYSCQGARSLEDAADNAGYRVEEVIARLEVASAGGIAVDWFTEPLPSLIEYLTSDHRTTIDVHLPELRDGIESAIAAAGEPIELRRMRILFRHLSKALVSHVLNEERELFPFIDRLHAANGDGLQAPKMRISQRVLRELVEHETFRDRLRTLNELAQRLPQSESVNALRSALRAFIAEVNRHMHLENNVLYPRAIELENELRRTSAASV